MVYFRNLTAWFVTCVLCSLHRYLQRQAVFMLRIDIQCDFAHSVVFDCALPQMLHNMPQDPWPVKLAAKQSKCFLVIICSTAKGHHCRILEIRHGSGDVEMQHALGILEQHMMSTSACQGLGCHEHYGLLGCM